MSAAPVRAIIREYGEKVTIKKYGEEKTETTKALIQPLRFKDNKNLYGNYLEIGVENDGAYLYVGSPEVRLDTYPFDSSIKTDTESYVLKKAEKVCVKNEILYVRAILKKCS